MTWGVKRSAAPQGLIQQELEKQLERLFPQ